MMTYRGLAFCFIVSGLIPIAGSAAAQEWTRFRGPNGSGVSQAQGIPVKWTAEEVDWRTELPGPGHSSPVIWGERVFLTCADQEQEKRWLVCMSTETGKILWQQQDKLPKGSKHKQNSHASCTPTVDAQHVYTLWQGKSESSISAYTHDGELAWKYDLGIFKAGHGSAVSPIVYRDLVVICNDHQGDAFLVALDTASGKERWKVARESMRPCYSTPCVFEPKGRPAELIFTHSYQGITSIDPDSGKLNWEIKPFGTFKQRACASPIVAGDLIFGTSGFATAEKNLIAVRPDYSADSATANEVYRVSKAVPHVPTPLAYQDWMFLWTDRGIVSCIETSTGKNLWTERVGGNFFGSPICIDGKLYNTDTNGTVVVVAAADKYELLGKSSLGETTCATPAVSGSKLFLRTDTHLTCVSGK